MNKTLKLFAASLLISGGICAGDTGYQVAPIDAQGDAAERVINAQARAGALCKQALRQEDKQAQRALRLLIKQRGKSDFRGVRKPIFVKGSGKDTNPNQRRKQPVRKCSKPKK